MAVNRNVTVRRIAVRAAVVLLLVPLGVELRAQSLSSALAQLESKNYEVRRAGFYRIFALANQGAPPSASLRPGAQRLARYAHKNPQVATALIKLLERENTPDPTRHAENEDPYDGDLIGCVATLKDPRAANALFVVIESGNMATEGLAALGEAALPRLLAAVRSPDDRHQLAALRAISQMAVVRSEARVTAKGADEIRNILLTALKDPNRFLRSATLEGLASFSDAEARAALEDVAKNDPEVVALNGRSIYPLRERATALLAKRSGPRSREPPH